MKLPPSNRSMRLVRSRVNSGEDLYTTSTERGTMKRLVFEVRSLYVSAIAILHLPLMGAEILGPSAWGSGSVQLLDFPASGCTSAPKERRIHATQRLGT